MWIYNSELYHHGIIGQKWGIRRYQNPDGSLTPEGKTRYEKKDAKWATKRYDKIYNKAYKRSKKEFNSYLKKDLNKQMSPTNSSGKLSMTYVNQYNRKLAELMTKNASDITAPSGRVVKFVAKRGEMGVHMAIADYAYNMNAVKNGIYSDGRIAYKKSKVNIANN